MSRFNPVFNGVLASVLCLESLLIGCAGESSKPMDSLDVMATEDLAVGVDINAKAQDSGSGTDLLSDSAEDVNRGVGWPGCTEGFGEYEVVTDLDTAVLVEASGLAASHLNPGILWSHNDSGDGPNVYAVSTDGTYVTKVTLEGIDPVDFEDLARAACPDGTPHCLWIADIGNNNQPRDEFSVIAFPEPELGLTSSPTSVSTHWVFRISYPDDAPDSEGLIVKQDGTKFWLFEKADGPTVRLFGTELPLVEGETQVLEEVLSFPSPGIDVPAGRRITGADLHPGEASLLIRTYTGVFEYTLAGPLDFEALLSEPLVVAWGPLEEPQGESVTYDASGLGAWTLSEDPQGKGKQPLIYYPCLDADSPQ
jgi:hypothetical protein